MKTYKMDDGFMNGYCAFEKTGQHPEFEYDSDTEWVRAIDAQEIFELLKFASLYVPSRDTGFFDELKEIIAKHDDVEST